MLKEIFKKSSEIGVKIGKVVSDEALWLYTVIIFFVKSLLLLYMLVSENPLNYILLSPIKNDTTTFTILYFSFIIALLSWTLLLKKRFKLWILISLNILMSIVIFIDALYFRAFGNLGSVHLLGQTSNLDNLESSIFSFVKTWDIFFFVDIPFIIGFVLVKRDFYKNNTRKVPLFVVMLVLSIAYISAISYKFDYKEKGNKGDNLFRICWSPNQTISDLSPVGFHIYDAYLYFKEETSVELSGKDKKRIDEWFKANQESIPDNKYCGMSKGKNLLCIQVESLENFVINRKFNGQEITPNINKLLKNSLYFSEMREQVNCGTSSDSDLMVNTSVYPVRRGSTFFRFEKNVYNSLPNLLEKKEYNTVAIHPDKGSYWNWMPSLYSIGFDKCIDSKSYEQDEVIGLGISDASYMRQIEPIIAKQKQPFYTFMVTLSSHAPFDIADKYRELKMSEELNKTKMGGCFQAMHYTDKHIGILLEKLDKEGVLGNTVVVIFGDHEGIHKFYQNEVDDMKSPVPVEDWWKTNDKKIPLIVYNKNITGEEIKTIGGQIDIFPTISYLLGIDEKEIQKTAFGKNMLKTNKNFTILNDGKIIGENVPKDQRKHMTDGIEVADLAIRGDYYRAAGYGKK